jgi:hypothetical protein
MQAELPELRQLESVIAAAAGRVDVAIACVAEDGAGSWPVHAITLGSSAGDAPAVGFFGGVHGLERIGSRVVIAYLESLVMRLQWDALLDDALRRVRLVFMPLVNPGGMARGTRANPQGVDLMRNAPVDAADPVAPLVGGQRIGAGLPWYRGRAGAPMEAESAALCAVVQRELHGRPFALAIDCHSGFGMRDRLWFPYAHCRSPIAHIAEMHALNRIFEQSYAQHPYLFEPQSEQYLAHGDLWDHLYRTAPDGGVFLPLTLEMGSWLWIRKNPRQIFRSAGMFNPEVRHREQRVLRRHVPLFDFAVRAAAGWRQWLPGQREREAHRRAALARWY